YCSLPGGIPECSAQGKVSVPQAVTPSYTREYHAALLRDPSITYLVLHSRNVPPAVSPADASICHLGSVPCKRRDVRGQNGGKFENDKNKTFLYQTISHTFCP
ncbi:unnamed protein product, partial [Staurois parvus]